MPIAQDFIDLFTLKRQGHIGKYVYHFRPHIYEEIIRQENYYPFRIEQKLIEKYAQNIVMSAEDIDQIIELGPGSRHPVIKKTIPLLSAFAQQGITPNYSAVDTTKIFADQACQIIEESIPEMITQSYHLDFSDLYLLKDLTGKKLAICFGQPIFANNDDGAAQKILKDISQFMNHGDLFLLTADCTQDEPILLQAYDTKLGKELLLNALSYLNDSLQPHGFDPAAFDHNVYWNPLKHQIELSLVATKNQNIEILQQLVQIQRGQKYTLLYSRKPKFSTIIDRLAKVGFAPLDQKIYESDQKNYHILLMQKIAK